MNEHPLVPTRQRWPQRPLLADKDISQCFTSFWRSFLPFCGSFAWRRSEITGLFLVVFFYWTKRKKKDNHPAVCMTQKHQLKTILCITYYFMLGWNLSACINSLYKLRLAGSGQPLCWGNRCGSVFRRVVVSVRGCGESRGVPVPASSYAHHERWRRRSKRRLICVLQSFRGGVRGVEILIKYLNQASPSLRRRGKKGFDTCIGKEMGCFKK